jgi:putative membrane protein
MRMTSLMAGVALVALMAQPVLAQSQDQTKPQQQTSTAGAKQQLAPKDMDFVNEAADAGMAEVKLGKLAQDQAKSDPVQQFGKRMVDDHSKANDKLKSIAEQKGIDLPQDQPADAQKAYDDLKQKSGQEFDQAFMDTMVQDHQKAVDLFQQEAKSGKDADLQHFAEATLPTLQEHLDLAKKTQEQVTASDTGATQDQAAASAPAPAQPDKMQGQQQAEDTGAPTADQSQAASATPKDQGSAVVAPMTDQQQAAAEPTPTPAAGQDKAATPEPMTDQQQAAAEPMAAPVLAKDVIGTDVVNSNGDQVGEIKDLVIDANQVQYAVVSVGGFLGIGDKEVVIPLEQLKLGDDKSYLTTAETVDQLKQMPEYDKDQYKPKG